MWSSSNSWLFPLILLTGTWIYRGLNERYLTSDLREKESRFISNYFLSFSLVFLLIFGLRAVSDLLFTLEPSFIDVSFSADILLNVTLYGGLLGTVIVVWKYPFKKVRYFQRLKLADEVYLDRTDELKISQLFIHPYKFQAKMIDEYSSEKLARIRAGVLLIFFILLVLIFFFLSPRNIYFYFGLISTSILLSAFIWYIYKRNISHYEDAKRIARRWTEKRPV